MSLTGALNAALSGIQTSTTAVQIISSNVANAQTPGYTEKSIDLSQIVTGGAYGGAEVSGYTRVSDSVLSATLNSATSTASYLSTQNSYLSQIQSILDSSSTTPTLSATLSNFQSAWTEFAAAPESSTDQAQLVSAGEQMANAVGAIASQLGTLQSNAESSLSTTVTTLNTDLQQVQSLNTQIQTAEANSQSPSDLEDQRDQVVNQIAAITNVQIMQRNDGTIALYTPGGTLLLDGQAQTFSVSNNTVVNAIGADVSGSLTGGSLQARTDFLSTNTSNTGNGVAVISKLQAQLQGFVSLFTNTASGGFASTYNSATTNTGELASSFFTVSPDTNGNPDLSTFEVNSSLVNDTSLPKSAAAVPIANTFTATNLAINTTTNTTTSTFSAGGLTASNQTYSGIANAILSFFQQAANSVSTSYSTASTQQSYYQSALSSETGVNTDTELVNLTNWQNSYAASAHVISTIEAMFTTLENMIA